ncbi:MAG: PKD domain-containing protein, partial [Calditrichaeota bacterium]
WTFRTVLRVEDDSDSPCNYAADEISVWVNAPPIAQAGEDMRGAVGQVLTFNGDKSSDSDGEMVSYQWDFGDAQKSLGKSVQHAYAAPGKYTVRLTVTDNANVSNSSQWDELVVVINDPPIAQAGNDTKGAIGEELFFDGSGSIDKDGALINYFWEFGDGSRGEGRKTSHVYEKSGLFTVVLTVQDDSQTESDKRSDNLQVFINEPPVADAGEDQLVTASEVAYTAVGSVDQDGEIISYDWNFGDGANGTGLTPKHIYSETGRYQIKLTVTDNSGTKSNQASDVVNVVINEKPIADAGPDVKAATEQPIVFNAAGSRDPDGEIVDYSWDFGDGRTASGVNVSHQYPQSGVYSTKLTVKDNTSQPLATDFDEAIVTVNAQPVALAGANRLTSPGETVRLDGSSSYDWDNDALTFQWQFSDGKTSTAAAQVNRSFDQPGIYTGILTVSDQSGTGNSVARDTVEVRINSAPIANAGENIFCCDKTLIFDASSSVDPDGDPLTFTWDFGDGCPFAQGMHVMHKFDRGGSYPVILTVDDGLGLKNSRHSTAITVTINNPPIADAGENETHCSGEVILFNAGNSKDPENGLLKYLWDFGDGTTAEGMNPTKIYKQDGVYQVKLTVQDDSGLPCNTDVAVKSIRIIESPVAFAGADQEVCTNAQVIFDGTASKDYDGVVNSYFWDFGDGITGGGATPTHTYKKAGVYRVVLTITGDLRGECDNTDTDEMLVTVYNAPLAEISCPEVAAINLPVAFDGSLSTSEGMAISEYLWDFGDGGVDQGKIVSHRFEKSGNYLVTLTINTDATTVCNSSVAKKLITINDRPIADAGSDQLVGINQVFMLNAAASSDPDGALVSFIWDCGAGQYKSGIITRHRIAEVGRRPIVLTVTDNTTAENNADSDTVWVTVNDPPVPVITSIASACPGESVNFSAADSPKMEGKTITCSWNFGDGQIGEGLTVSHAYAKSGHYTVTLIMVDGLKLDNSSNSTSKILYINRAPIADAGKNRRACPGEELVFDAGKSFDPDGSGWSAAWDFGDGVKSTEKMVKHTFQKPGRYSVRLRVTDDSGTACAGDDQVISVIVNSPPVADAGVDRQVYLGGAHDAVLFDAIKSSDADGDGLVYTWDFGDGTRAEGARLFHTFSKPGVYLVKLVVDDGRKTSCSRAQDEVKIEVMRRE